MSRRGTGRKRMNIEQMEDVSARQVTFSKRRSGLFKKGSELCTLCGAEVAMVVFSPGGKVYSFGHPYLESVIDRYLGQAPPQTDDLQQLVLTYRMSKQLDLNRRVTELKGLIEEEDKKSKQSDEVMKKMRTEGEWWEKPFDELNLPELEGVKASLGTLHNYVLREAHLLGGGAPSNPMEGRFNQVNLRPRGFNGRGRAPIFSRDNMVPMNANVPNDAMALRSSRHMVSINTHIPEMGGNPPYDNPMVVGSSHDGVSINTQTNGLSGNTPYDSMTTRFGHGVTIDAPTPRLNEQGPYDPMVVGSSHGVPIGTRDKGKAPYDPMAARSSHWVPLDTNAGNALGFKEQGLYNPLATRSHGFNQGAPYDAIEDGSSHRVPIDTTWASGFNGRAVHEHDPVGVRSSERVLPFDNSIEFLPTTRVPSGRIPFNYSTSRFEEGPSIDPSAPGPNNRNRGVTGSGASFDARANVSSMMFRETSHGYGHFSRND